MDPGPGTYTLYMYLPCLLSFSLPPSLSSLFSLPPSSNSPICHHIPVYTGSPIPIQFDESSADEATPLKYVPQRFIKLYDNYHSRPGSPLLTSSPATFTRSDSGLRTMRRVHADKGVGPRNLMEVIEPVWIRVMY